MKSEIFVIKCQCGWNFLSLNQWTKKCPQCRDEIKYCMACDHKINDKADSNFCYHCRPIFRCAACHEELNSIYSKFCQKCGKSSEKINKRIWAENNRAKKNFKYKEISICNYDCFNCKYSDCIQPVDKDEDIKQGELF
jgi:hypothetical protein